MNLAPYAEAILDGIDRITTSITVDNSHQPTPKGIIRMSEVGYCARRLGYKLAGHPNHYSRGSGLTFGIGKYAELLVLEGMSLAGFEILNAQAECVVERPPMRGHFDAEAIPPDREDIVTVEIKSANQNNFTNMAKNGVAAVYPEYIAQAQMYTYTRARQRCLFVVVNKNMAQVHTEWIELDHAYAIGLIEKAAYVIECIQRGQLPEPEYTKASRQCRQCPYKDICDGKPVNASKGSIRMV